MCIFSVLFKLKGFSMDIYSHGYITDWSLFWTINSKSPSLQFSSVLVKYLWPPLFRSVCGLDGYVAYPPSIIFPSQSHSKS